VSIEDVIAITTLQSKYANLFDQGRLDEVMELFAEDSECELGVLGSARGLGNIKAQYARLMQLTGVPGERMHALTNAVVEVALDGLTAAGEWAVQVHRVEPSTDSHRVGTLGYYNNSFRREGAGWKITKLELKVVWTLNKPGQFESADSQR
jgi:hypothetical protein